MIKNLKIFMMLISIAAMFGCDEDKVGTLIVGDAVPPSVISINDNSVRNFPGGSEITYNLPSDDDGLMYVQGEYSRTEGGEIVSVKSSVYNNSLIVEGFAEEGVYDVELFAVDQSGNKSEGVAVTINPEKPPYLYVCETIYAEPTYGGLDVYWDNPKEGLTVIELYRVSEGGGLVFEDVINTESAFGVGQILGLSAVETDFVFIIKDAYGNQCDRVEFTATPLYIEIFDRSKFQSVFQPYDQEPAYADWPVSELFDGNISSGNGFHTIAISPGNDPNPVLPYYEGHTVSNGTPYRVPLFTIDLGSLNQLYRFTYWPRVNYQWRHGTPKKFDLWGSDKLNADGSLDGWTLLLDNVGPVKPSGTECDNSLTTEEDINFANAGINFDISPDMPKVRYIRFAQREGQNCISTLFVMTELQFSGDNR